MPVRNKLSYLLIKKLDISKKTANALLEQGTVAVNNEIVTQNAFFLPTDHIVYNQNIVLQEGKKIITIAFYKPRGIETTLNTNIENNLKTVIPFPELPLFPIGRLDKESEGLLILTNDGKRYRDTVHYNTKVEKEYIVKVNKAITLDFVEKMSNGIVIMGKTTLPCEVKKLDDLTFSIVLTQGLNRQIRRMCYQLHYEVLELKRIRIGKIVLEGLKSGEFKLLYGY